MLEFRSNQDLYDMLDKIAADFENQGETGAAEEVRFSMLSGATSTEVFGNIYKMLRSLKKDGYFKESKYAEIVSEIIRILKKQGYR